MSWLNTMLGAANLGMEIAQVGQLNSLKQQGVVSEIIQEIQRELRNQIFNYRKAAEEILEYPNTQTRIKAGAMRLLELKLQDSGITTDLFDQLQDKEYVDSTYKFIHQNGFQLKNELSLEESSEADEMAMTAHRIPEYSYYIDHRDELLEYEKAKDVTKSLGFLSKFFVEKGLGCLVFIVFIISVLLFGYIFVDNFTLGIIIGVVVGLIVAIWFRRQVNKSKSAKKKMEELEQNLDLELLMALDREFGKDLVKARNAKQAAESQVRQFFGESPFLPI